MLLPFETLPYLQKGNIVLVNLLFCSCLIQYNTWDGINLESPYMSSSHHVNIFIPRFDFRGQVLIGTALVEILT